MMMIGNEREADQKNKAYQYIISCMSNLDWGREIGGMDKATRFPEHLPHTSLGYSTLGIVPMNKQQGDKK